MRRWGRYLPPICQLPTELLASVLHSALPRLELTSCSEAFTSRMYMRSLYTIRQVSKQWKGVVDGTPSFWAVVLSTLPPHVNDATIIRSATLPLTIVYEYIGKRNIRGHPTPDTFLRTIAHTRSRWSALVLDIPNDGSIPGYLAAPAPLLQTLVVRSSWPEDLDSEPPELLGGQTGNLRSVSISAALIRWKMGLFSRLKALNLTEVRFNLTANHVVDFLQASPYLEELSIKGDLQVVTNQNNPPIITLSHLKSIDLGCGDIKATEYILQHIRAPSCIRFMVCIGEEDEPELSRCMHETLKPFHDILRKTHMENRTSDMVVKVFQFDWRSIGEECSFIIQIGTCWPMGIHWVEQILQKALGVRVVLRYGSMISDVVMRDIALMRCVTGVSVSTAWTGGLRQFLQLLCRPLGQITYVPSFSNLRELELPSRGWNAQELLDMVQLRRSMFSKTTIDQPRLTINIRREIVMRNFDLITIPDLAILTKIQGADGVEGVRFLAPECKDGNLAVVWNEEASAPSWGS